jgi:hypothetical protein
MNVPIKPEVAPPVGSQPKSLTEHETDFQSEGAPAPSPAGIAKPVCEDAWDFPEGREDPRQAEELERQQDA